MCKYTYHHFPLCGHISNWTVVSCLDFTHQIRAVGQRQGLACDRVEIKHDLNQKASETSCAQCDIDWCDAVSHDTMDDWLHQEFSSIEGFNADRPLFEYSVCMNPNASSDPAEYYPTSPDTDDLPDVLANFNLADIPGPPDSPSHSITGADDFPFTSPIICIRSDAFTLSITDKSEESALSDGNLEARESSDSRRHRHIRIRYRRPIANWYQDLHSPEDCLAVNCDCDRVSVACPSKLTSDSSSRSPVMSSTFSKAGFSNISSNTSSLSSSSGPPQHAATGSSFDYSTAMSVTYQSGDFTVTPLWDSGHGSDEGQEQGHPSSANPPLPYSSPASSSSASSSSAFSDTSTPPERFRSVQGRIRTPYPRMTPKAPR